MDHLSATRTSISRARQLAGVRSISGGGAECTAAFTAMNLVVDILYAFLDPRVRYE